MEFRNICTMLETTEMQPQTRFPASYTNCTSDDVAPKIRPGRSVNGWPREAKTGGEDGSTPPALEERGQGGLLSLLCCLLI